MSAMVVHPFPDLAGHVYNSFADITNNHKQAQNKPNYAKTDRKALMLSHQHQPNFLRVNF
jgi:hypothetical protein